MNRKAFGISSLTAALFLLVCTFVSSSASPDSNPASTSGNARKIWNFESDQPGENALGFISETGTWEVAHDEHGNVIAQKAKNAADTFNMDLVTGTSYLDLDLSVRLKAIAGDRDRGGGVVWRARDKDNYYVARFNPLEGNFRVYKVEQGTRTQFASARVPGDTKWHTLRVTMIGVKITCYLDGEKYLEAEDTTFGEPGKVGLWCKSDAQTYFDDLTAVPTH